MTDTGLPADLRARLAEDETARRAFDALPASHRREYVTWIDEAKRSETRRRRIDRTVEMVKG